MVSCVWCSSPEETEEWLKVGRCVILLFITLNRLTVYMLVFRLFKMNFEFSPLH